GLISGILLMGVGMGPILVAPIFTNVSLEFGWRPTFIGMGIIAAICFVAATFILREPSEADLLPYAKKNAGGKSAVSEDIPPFKMLQHRAFWIYFAWVVLLNSASMAVNSQAYPLAEEVFMTTARASVMDAAAIAALLSVLVSLFSVFNGIGRVIFGIVFDRKGRNLTLLIVSLGFVLSCVILGTSLSTSNFILVMVGLILLGFIFGALPTMSSAFSRDFFGAKFYSLNFPLLNMSVLTSSFTGPLLAGNMYDAAGSYEGLLWWLVVLCIVGTGICLFIRKPGESIKNFKK
ncbi:MAG: OFA family MFS transporter, partial [Clostridiales bacterium]|nr:OFA family MFS transporter [Clostridiales bacterium]